MYASPGVNGQLAKNKKERKVSIVFRHTDSQQHCSGVESVLVSPTASHTLFTASRDSTIKRWDTSKALPTCQASFEGHVGWVNDIALYRDLLVSCSADRTVKMWKATSDGQCVHSSVAHSDYVTCVAAAVHQPLVASGGLRSELILHDLTTGSAQSIYPPSSPHSSQGAASNNSDNGSSNDAVDVSKGSIYALAMSPDGAVVVSGTTESVIRLFDTRSGQKVLKLKGHTDNVRALLLNGDGTLLLSGASDHTLRLWDLGQQRCIQTYAVHTDSVWTLQAPDNFSVVFSGGRDKHVYRTQLATRQSELLCVEAQPVRRLALDAATGSLWCATSASSVNRWAVPREFAPTLGAGLQPSAGRTFVVSSSPVMRMRLSADARLHAQQEPHCASPAQTVPGAPGIVAHKILTNRRHILTRDSNGDVDKWDVLTGSAVDRYGPVDIAAKERELFYPISAPSWFSADNKLGALTIHLEPPSCFLAEVYAVDLDIPAADDVKKNLGVLVLQGVFDRWRRCYTGQVSSSSSGEAHATADGGAATANGAMEGQEGPGASGAALPASPAPWPNYTQGLPPAVICQTTDGHFWRRLVTQFTGQEREHEDIPTWISDVVLREVQPVSKEHKCAFILHPFEGSNLPSLLQSKLNAPRILQVNKVANYCISKLAEQNVHLMLQPVYLRPPPADDASAQQPETSQASMELLCNGMAVPYDMSLATVKKYIWRRSEDVLFHFRIRDPGNPAPLPVIHPPI